MKEKSETLCSPFFESLKDKYSKKIFNGEVAINYETDQDWSQESRKMMFLPILDLLQIKV